MHQGPPIDAHGVGALQQPPAGRALEILSAVIEHDPGNLHARYCRGLIYQQVEELALAHADFRIVTDEDPNDAHGWYRLGSTVGSITAPGAGGQPQPTEEEVGEQIAALERALVCNPYLTPAVYRLAVAYRFRGDPDGSRKLLERWKQLEGRTNGIRVGDEVVAAYGDEGRYAQVINPLVDRESPPSPFRRPRFDPPAALRVQLAEGERWISSSDFAGRLAVIGRARARFGAPIVAFDADGDDRIDLFLPAAITGPRGVRDALLLNRDEGSFEEASRRMGFPADRASLGAAAGDFDGDGRIDLVLTGAGAVHLLHNEGPGGFKDVTAAAGLTAAPALTLTARWLDLDQDGDLDLYVVNYTGLQHLDRAFTGEAPPGFANFAYRNDGRPAPIPGAPPGDQAPKAMAHHYADKATGGLSIKMTPWAGSDVLLGGDAPHTGLAALDIDDDRDLDLVLASEGATPLPILNDRLGRFHRSTIHGPGSHVADAGLFAAELDGDGYTDLVTTASDGEVTAWKNRSRQIGGGVSLTFDRWPSSVRGGRGVSSSDVDLDGRPDLLVFPRPTAFPSPDGPGTLVVGSHRWPCPSAPTVPRIAPCGRWPWRT